MSSAEFLVIQGFNPPGGFGAFGTGLGGDGRHAEGERFNPPGGFGAFGTRPDAQPDRRTV